MKGKIKNLIYKSLCHYRNCSDADDIQYPNCSIFKGSSMRITCACKLFNVNALAERIIKLLK